MVCRARGRRLLKPLSKLLSIGGLYVEEVLTRASVEKNRAASSLSAEETERIYGAVLSLGSDLSHVSPHIVVGEGGKWVDVLPFPLKVYSGLDVKGFPDL